MRTLGQDINKSGLQYKLKLLLSLDVPIHWRGQLCYLGVQFLIGPVLRYVIQVAVKVHQ